MNEQKKDLIVLDSIYVYSFVLLYLYFIFLYANLCPISDISKLKIELCISSH